MGWKKGVWIFVEFSVVLQLWEYCDQCSLTPSRLSPVVDSDSQPFSILHTIRSSLSGVLLYAPPSGYRLIAYIIPEYPLAGCLFPLGHSLKMYGTALTLHHIRPIGQSGAIQLYHSIWLIKNLIFTVVKPLQILNEDAKVQCCCFFNVFRQSRSTKGIEKSSSYRLKTYLAIADAIRSMKPSPTKVAPANRLAST